MTQQYALERATRTEASGAVRSDPGAAEGEAGHALLCASCGHPITSKDLAVAMNGSHRHTFANPHGLVFRIGCFSAASGCRMAEGEQVDFTWFAGYAWSVEQCAGCGLHMGWRFRSGVHVFHGLVYDRLVEAGEGRAGGHTQ